MGLQRGDVVDRYRLEEPLGTGSFGEVWKASQLVDGEPIGVTCAIKVMRLAHERAGSSPRTFAIGWLDEVRNLVRVIDDTIPRIYEANVWNGHAYIAMELLEGATLAARLSRGPIPWRRALFIADQIARALETAHQIDIIHRDLKPQNVMLVGAQRVCVVDWGIARVHTSTEAAAPDVIHQPTTGPETTDTGPVAPITIPHARRAIGTPGYMAPEVYEGVRPALEQDVYALGVVLYQMIAGCLPHAVDANPRNPASSDSMKAYRLSLDKATMDYSLVPLQERCPSMPRGVVELVDQLLAHEPGRRPRQLREAIEHANRFPDGVPDPPYAGLGTLGPRHAALYFGQQEAIQRVLERLASQPGVLLWGPSGCGKSSLALAGVASRMDRTLFLGMDGWDVHVIRPREGHGFGVASDASPALRPAIGHAVIIDQLEEIVDLGREARRVFCAAVLALLDRSAPVRIREEVLGIHDTVKVIATIRDDLEWRVDREVPELRPLLERRVIVTDVDANFARSIIAEPARALGYSVEGIDEVSREVEERLASDPAKLPVLQYALSEWWERRDASRGVLPVAAWSELGGVNGALSFVAERFYRELDHGEAQRVKELLVSLFQGGRKQPLAEAGLARRDHLLMERLTRLRLVGRREKKETGPFYEAEHEHLAENWVRLASWLADARDDLVLAEELERDATAYQRDPNAERLWRKGRLAAALELAESGRVGLSPTAKLFLGEGEGKERRGRLVWRIIIGAVVILALTIGDYFLVNFKAANAAKQREETAEAAKRDAEQRVATAEAAKHSAEWRMAEAEGEKNNAEQRLARADAEKKTVEQRLSSSEQRLRKAEADRSAADQRAAKAEADRSAADQRATKAEADRRKAEADRSAADQRARKAEADRSAADQRARKAEADRKAAEERAMAAEDRAKARGAP
jgi:hypothetical protein